MMRSFTRLSATCLTLVALTGCFSDKTNEIIDDKEVFREVLPALLDSMYVEVRYDFAPPPIMRDTTSGQEKFIQMEKYPQLKENYRDDLKLRNENKIQFYFIIADTIRGIDQSDIQDYSLFTIVQSEFPLDDYKLGLNKVTPQIGSTILLASENPFVRFNPKIRVLETLEFSRIVFNHDQSQGMLTCKFQTGGWSGLGYKIYMRKRLDDWIIQDIKLDYVL